MFRRFSSFSKKKQNSRFRNNRILKSFLLAPKVLLRNETAKEACVLSYYGLFGCIPILVFFLRLSQSLFLDVDWKEWLLIKFPDYKEPILAIVDAAHRSPTNNVSVVLVGSFFVFCWAGILMLVSLEDSLNKIFRMGWTPISLHRLITYFVITLISPMVFIIVSGFWVYVTQIMPIQYPRLLSLSHLMAVIYFLSLCIPYLGIYAVLFCCYSFLPRVSVKKNAAFTASLVAGTLWIIFQKIFFCLQYYLFNYSFTYGALVALPSFLLLLYFYACLYLFGGVLTFLIQNQGYSFILSTDKYLPNCYTKLVISIYILAEISRDFDEGYPSPTLESLAKNSNVPIGELAQCLEILESEGLVLSYKETYKPSYYISELTIQDILEKLLHLHTFSYVQAEVALRLVQTCFHELLDQAKHSVYNLTLKDIARKL